MIRPLELGGSSDVWDAIYAASSGDVTTLSRLLEHNASVYRAQYWYTEPIHVAVREGHLDVVRLLLDAGADPDVRGLDGEDLVTVARDRGHEAIAIVLEEVCAARGRTPVSATIADHPIHVAAAAGDVAKVRELLDAEPQLVHRGDGQGGTPLHRATAASQRAVMSLLLDRGADIHAVHGAGPGSPAGYAAIGFQPIDLAFWTGPFWGVRGDIEGARLLLERGAAYDITIASALGDLDRVKAFLEDDPRRIRETRPCGKRPLSSAVELGHAEVARLLLERGAGPNWPEGSTASRGAALHAASRAGDQAMVELLLAHGADPNGSIDSSGSATYVAKTRELRALLLARGGVLDAFDLVWMGEDDEVVRRVAADPGAAHTGCGGALAAACRLGKRDLLVRLLAAGARVPPVLTACRSYLMTDPEMLRLLLASGMNPDLPNWQHATPLHDLCGRDSRGRPHEQREACAAILLDAGATISARDDHYRSTPLAWAARSNLPEMVDFLLARGAATNLPDDEPWATPLAWATRRGHTQIAERLRRAGATR
jgi:ankyrin repeat protein